MPSAKRGRAPLRDVCPSLVPFNVRRALNEYENVLSYLYLCIDLLEDDTAGDAADAWYHAQRYATRLSCRLQNGALERLDIETRNVEAIEALYRKFCIVRDAFQLSAPTFPRVFRSKKRKLPMTCLELVEKRRELGLIGDRYGLARLIRENDTFTDDPRAAELGYPIILQRLFPEDDFDDCITFLKWRTSGESCKYEPATEEEIAKVVSLRYGPAGNGLPVKPFYASCATCKHLIETDLIDKFDLHSVYRQCDGDAPNIRALREHNPQIIAAGFDRNGGKTEETERPGFSRPYSPKELAQMFNCSWKTLKKRIQAGQVRAMRLTTKGYRIHVDDLPNNAKSE